MLTDLALVDVPVNMQYKFQQSLFMNPGVLQFLDGWLTFQLHADPGMHSAHSAADRGLSQVQFLGWLSCACCCATTGALVGRKLWSSAVAVLVAVVQFLDKVVVPVGATTVGRAMLGSTMDTCSASSRVAFGRICTIFYMKG